MYHLAAVLLVAALSFQGSAAVTDADIQDPSLKHMAEYLVNFPSNIMKAWEASSAQALRTTQLATLLAQWATQLTNPLQSNDCVEKLRNDYNTVKNEAIKAYNACVAATAPPAVTLQQLQAKANEDLDALKKYDTEIQKVTKECEDMSTWKKFACVIGIQQRIFTIRSEARTLLMSSIYNNVQTLLQQSGSEITTCIIGNTAALVEEINLKLQEFYKC